MYASKQFEEHINEYIKQFAKCTKEVYETISNKPFLKIDCTAPHTFISACQKEKGIFCDSNLQFKVLGYEVELVLSVCTPNICTYNEEDMSEITRYLNDISQYYCGNSSGIFRECQVSMKCEKSNSKTIIIVGGAIIGFAFLGFLGVGILLYAKRNDEEVRNLFQLNRMNQNEDEELNELVYDDLEVEYEVDDNSLPSNTLI